MADELSRDLLSLIETNEDPVWESAFVQNLWLWSNLARTHDPRFASDLAEASLEHLIVPPLSVPDLESLILPSRVRPEPLLVRRVSEMSPGGGDSHLRSSQILFHPNGEMLFSVEEGGLSVIDVSTMEMTRFIQLGGIGMIDVDPSGETVACATNRGQRVALLEWETGEITGGWEVPNAAVDTLHFLDETLLVGFWSPVTPNLRLFDIEENRELGGTDVFATSRGVAGRTLHGELLCTNVAPFMPISLQRILTGETVNGPIANGLRDNFAFSSDGERVLFVQSQIQGSNSIAIREWDWEQDTTGLLATVEGIGYASTVVTLPSDDQIIIGNWNGAHLCDTETGDVLASLVLPFADPKSITVSFDGSLMAMLTTLGDQVAIYDLTPHISSSESTP